MYKQCLTHGLAGSSINRRTFNQWLLIALTAGVNYPAFAQKEEKLRVAAIQMTPVLADIAANLEQAEKLIREAQKGGAQWIALPEMFTSAAAFHPDMLSAIRPIDGEPARLMRRLAREGQSVIGGSFLASRDGQVYNSFLLVFPDGTVLNHDKDYPSYWENCITVGGQDDGVLSTPLGNVGAALCWEFIRSRTAHRLRGRTRLVIGGSCWWTLPDEIGENHPLRDTNLQMLKQTPPRFARMLGVPVIHGSHTGPFKGYYSPDLPDVPFNSSYLGEAMIVDARGKVLARRGAEQGAGIVIAEISLPAQAQPSLAIPNRFWIPAEMPATWKASWKRWFNIGGHYYQSLTKPYLDTGKIREYVPQYMM